MWFDRAQSGQLDIHEIYIFEYQMKTSDKKQNSLIEKIKRKLKS